MITFLGIKLRYENLAKFRQLNVNLKGSLTNVRLSIVIVRHSSVKVKDLSMNVKESIGNI